MDSDDLGTVRWFGESWGAPVCHPATKVYTPVTEPCEACDVMITEDDQGVTIPFVGSVGSWVRHAYHLQCFLAEVSGVRL
jgi:hypothetical protein